MNAGPFDGRREPRQRRRAQRQPLGEQQRLAGVVRRDEGQRDLRRESLFAPQARPERRVDHGFDGVGVRLGRERAAVARGTRGRQVPREMGVHAVGDGAGGGIGGIGQRRHGYVQLYYYDKVARAQLNHPDG